jgi:metalloendopeptidase OMA1, mitochondrial
MKKGYLRIIGLLAMAVFLLAGCATVPETGRTQFNIVPHDQEMQLGITTFEQMKTELPVSKDPAVNDLLRRVGARIAAVAELPDAQWEFVAFDSAEPNAFCLPGGKIGIYTGILPITQDEAGLATVIGHEVAHAVARHGAERMSSHLALQAGGQILGAAVGGAQPITQQLVAVAYGVGSQVGVALPHSRRQESEADQIGLLYMARAGYNPQAAIGFWERFHEYSERAGGGTPWFLRTHPVDEVRIRQIREWLPQAMAEYRPQ